MPPRDYLDRSDDRPPCILSNSNPPLHFQQPPGNRQIFQRILVQQPQCTFAQHFQTSPLFFAVLHGETEISGPLKKSRALVINAPPHNNQIPSIVQRNLSRDRINNQSRNSDASPRLHCRETTSPP
jgi:hypothetical protein